MFKTRIIYRLISILLIFAVMIVVPYSLTTIKQVQKMIEKEEAMETAHSEEYSRMHKEFTARLVEQMLPFVFYILVMAFIMSIFFLRKMLISMNHLRDASQAMKDGDLDIRLEVLTEDELGDVTRAFNDMAETLRRHTHELKQKDVYINAMLDPLWVVDEDNRITDINPAFTRLFGHTRDDIIGAHVYDLLDEKNALILRKQLEEKRDKGVSSIYEISVMSKAGAQIPVLISGSPIYAGDHMVGKIGILKDFREQASLRDELQQSLEYIESIMNSIPDQMLVINRDFRIVMANTVALTQLGRELTGELCHSVLHGVSMPCWSEGSECPVQISFATGKYHRTVHHHLDADGRKKYHEIIASPVTDASGKVLHVIELLRDVTDRMRSEEQILHKNRELTTLNSISSILNRSLRPDEIFSRVLDKMIAMLGMDGGGIFFLDEVSKEMVCQYHKGISDDYVKMIGRIRLGEDIPGRVAATGQIMTSADISKDQSVERSVLKHSGMRGYCCVPVRGKERIIGVFSLFSFSPHVFTLEEENILSAIGEMTGMALENMRLYEKMSTLYEQQRRRWSDEQHQLLNLSSILGAAVDITETMNQVLGVLKQIFRADFVWMLSLDGSGNLRKKAAADGTSGEDDIIYSAEVSSLEKFVLSKRQPAVIHDIRSEEKFYVCSGVSSYASAVAVPMFIADKAIGTCSFYYALHREFRDEDLHFMEIIANMIAVATERSEFYISAGKEKDLSNTILQSVHDGIITVDMDNRIISTNKAFERMTGILPKRSLRLPVCEVFRFSDENRSFRFYLGESIEEAKRGMTVNRSADLTTLYGNRIPVAMTSSPILDKNGGVTGVVNLVRDVSRERELDRMKTEIVRSVSHEFRTPLSAIVGMSEMLLNGDVEEDRTGKYLGTIRDEGLRLSRMVNELLSIARIESGKETLAITGIDLDQLFKSVAETFEPLLKKKHAVLRCDTGGLRTVVGDEEKIKQVLMNFVDNAITFSDDGCIIDMRAARCNDMLSITVTDTGWGIPEEDMPHLTERFYRGRHGDRVKGTGLGLSLCEEILRMHSGSMEIISRANEGTQITMSIPYREVD